MIFRCEPIDQADAIGHGGINIITEHQQFKRAPLPDNARQQIGRAHVRAGEADTRKQKRELSIVGHDAQIAGNGDNCARARGQTVDRGDDVDAATADRIGLVNRLAPKDQVLSIAQEWAARLAHGPTFSLGMTKAMVNNEWTMDINSAIEAEAQAQALMMMGEDHRTFYEAFRSKQKPEFKGR